MLIKELESLVDKKKAKILAKYFKTGKGEYGEGDVFIGITVPDMRRAALRYTATPLTEIQRLLESPIHEYRFTALLILTYQPLTKEIYDFYLNNTKYINNWDLVDVSASLIVGKYLFDKKKNILKLLAKSKNLWERRIAIIATHYFIKQKDLDTSLEIVELLLEDKHDLIHKSVGWTLREIGKVDEERLVEFLHVHKKKIRRTTLRYAIERFSPDERKTFMAFPHI